MKIFSLIVLMTGLSISALADETCSVIVKLDNPEVLQAPDEGYSLEILKATVRVVAATGTETSYNAACEKIARTLIPSNNVSINEKDLKAAKAGKEFIGVYSTEGEGSWNLSRKK